MPRLAHSLLLLCVALAGCRQRDIVPGVSDSLFVATMADLRRLQVPVGDSAVLASRRRQVLQQRGLTAEQLERAGQALATDPDVMDRSGKRFWSAELGVAYGFTDEHGRPHEPPE